MLIFNCKGNEENTHCNTDCDHGNKSSGAEARRMKIVILGSGCAKCNRLEISTREALKKLDMDRPIDHVTDFSSIAAYGVISTPALVIDGKVVSYGRVLSSNEIVNILEKLRE